MNKTIDEAVREVERDGYTVIEDFLSEDQLRASTEALARIESQVDFGRDMFSGTRTKRSSNLVGMTRSFDSVVTDERMLELARGVLGPDIQLSISAMIKIFPGESHQPLHQDDGLWPAPRPHQPFVLNTMYAIDDFTEANGGTTLVPGSHVSTDPVNQEAERVAVEMPRGSVLAWDGATWHGGGASRDDGGERCGLNINYNAGWLKQQENQFVCIPQEVVVILPKTLQRLLGYQTSFGGILGSAHGRDPLDVVTDRVRSSMQEPQ